VARHFIASYIAAVHPNHPLSEETAAWLDQQDPVTRYAAMLVFSLVVPYLITDPGWLARRDAARRELDPDQIEEAYERATRAALDTKAA
jgi:hypothetical protein